MIMWATIDQFLYNDLAGTKGPKYCGPVSAVPGFREIVIDPTVPEELESAGANFKTVRGEISSKWEKTAGSFNLDVQIPANTTAQIILPVQDFSPAKVTESGSTVWKENVFVSGAEGSSRRSRSQEEAKIKPR